MFDRLGLLRTSNGDPQPRDVGHHYRRIRTELVQKSARDVSHELPGLVDTVASVSEETADTRRFLIGVSFTPHHTCLDYQLDRVIETDDEQHPRVESLKSPVDSGHLYVRFTYPPDPRFDASALRSALLAALEDELREFERRQRSPTPRLSSIWRQLVNPNRHEWQ